MKLGLSLLASRRPGYFARVLDALARCDGLYQWHTTITLDDPDPDTYALARRPLPAASKLVYRTIGFPGSPRERISAATRQALTLWSRRRVGDDLDFVVHVEDDCVPEPGFLEWVRGMAIALRDEPSVFAVCGYRRDTIAEPAQFVPHFVPWGWGTWRDRLDEILRDDGPRPGQQWDERVQELRGGRFVAFPSRPLIENIGRIGTTPADVYDAERIGVGSRP